MSMTRFLLLPAAAFAAGCTSSATGVNERTEHLKALFEECSPHEAAFTALDKETPTKAFHVLIRNAFGPSASLHVEYEERTGAQTVTVRSGELGQRDGACLYRAVAKGASYS